MTTYIIMIKFELKQSIRKVIEKLYPEVSDFDFSVDEPPSNVVGDLACNVPLVLSKKLGSSPVKIAEEIAGNGIKFEGIQKIEVSKNGFLNFYLDESILKNKISQIAKEGEKALSIKDISVPCPVLIEFVSANPTGPLHVGHGRGAALGDSMARIYKQCGIPVKKEYYVNDMGVQMEVLARSVEARALQLQGQDVPFPENGYHGEYIQKLAQEMIQEKREDYRAYPKAAILKWIAKDLQDFGVSFDSWFEESALHKENKVEEALESLKSKNSLKLKEGALWFVSPGSEEGEAKENPEKGLDQDRVLKKSDGRYTYFASDVAYHRNKFERGFNQCIDIWGHDHHGYVPRLESALQVLDLPKSFLKILLYQLVSLKRDGKRISMSTRSGTFVTLKEVLDEVGPDACRFFFAMRSPNSQLDFDLDLAKKKSNENPVFYVQYVHARIASIFREALERKINVPSGSEGISKDVTLEPEEKELMKKLIFFPDLMRVSLEIASPHLIATYLIDCSTRFHRFYDKHRVLDAPEEIRQFRFTLLKATQNVVRLGLSLLGVSAPEKM